MLHTAETLKGFLGLASAELAWALLVLVALLSPMELPVALLAALPEALLEEPSVGPSAEFPEELPEGFRGEFPEEFVVAITGVGSHPYNLWIGSSAN